MGHKTRVTEEKEHGDHMLVVKKLIDSNLIEQDDYQVMVAMAMEAIRSAIKGGRQGNFGITFFVDAKDHRVKRAESFITESVSKVEI